MENYAKTNYPGIRAANPVNERDVRVLLFETQRKAWEDMQKIIQLLERYKEDPQHNNRYPQRLSELEQYGEVPSEDPWGNPYKYDPQDHKSRYDLISYGKDGREGGEDEDADIVNGAEIDLIGRWYDYTPTSAMDIGFNEDVSDIEEELKISS